jgi:hypothetical protein
LGLPTEFASITKSLISTLFTVWPVSNPLADPSPPAPGMLPAPDFHMSVDPRNAPLTMELELSKRIDETE